MLSNHTSPEFYPPSAQWIKCFNYTYRPHSNECGPRTLLAGTMMALHPEPSSNILLPLMHQNLAQISRTWIGFQLIREAFDHAPITSLINLHQQEYTNWHNAPGIPADLVNWHPPATTIQHNTAAWTKTHNRTKSIRHEESNLSPTAQIFTPQHMSRPQNLVNNSSLCKSKGVYNSRSFPQTPRAVMQVSKENLQENASKTNQSVALAKRNKETGNARNPLQPINKALLTNQVNPNIKIDKTTRRTAPAKRTSVLLPGQRLFSISLYLKSNGTVSRG